MAELCCVSPILFHKALDLRAGILIYISARHSFWSISILTTYFFIENSMGFDRQLVMGPVGGSIMKVSGFLQVDDVWLHISVGLACMIGSPHGLCVAVQSVISKRFFYIYYTYVLQGLGLFLYITLSLYDAYKGYKPIVGDYLTKPPLTHSLTTKKYPSSWSKDIGNKS